MCRHNDSALRPATSHCKGADTRWSLVAPPSQGWYASIKTPCDFCLAVILGLLAFPILVVAALAVKLTSRGPFLYRQTRSGRNGCPYTILKIRTMYHNCERHSGICWSTKGDPRITPVGRFLRLTHIDELPQLWNVLRGEMSLVGPRPERPEFVVGLEKALSHYRERLAVRPGITGLAAVQLPPDTDVESVRRKLAHDLYYIANMSWWLDVRILSSTALGALGFPYRIRRFLFKLPGGEAVERSFRVQAIPQAPPLFASGSTVRVPDGALQSGLAEI
jgi:lipopolysaccharide/colanic/teichoic acid biosynthesis glycosyltransferase